MSVLIHDNLEKVNTGPYLPTYMHAYTFGEERFESYQQSYTAQIVINL